MDFDVFLETAWNDHGDRPQEVADRLAGALDGIASSAQLGAFARIVTHVYGEHLGQWQAGILLLTRLRSTRCSGEDAASERVIARSIATLAYAQDAGARLGELSVEDRIIALAGAAAALAGRNAFKRAIAAYAEAIGLAEPGLPEASPALRALAIGGNNLAAALEEKPDRDPSETLGMVAAAEGGLQYWRRAGTWLEEERAEYRLASSLIAADQAARAVAHAERCIEICVANEAAPFEQFFGYAMLAAAQRGRDAAAFADARDRALELYDQVPENEKQWCARDRAALLR